MASEFSIGTNIVFMSIASPNSYQMKARRRTATDADWTKRTFAHFEHLVRAAVQGGPLWAKADSPALLNHLVSTIEQRRRHGKPQCFGGLEVDRKLVFGRRLHRQIARFLTFKNAINVTSGLPKLIDEIRAIGHQAPGADEIAFKIDRRQLVPCCKTDDQIAIDHCPRTSRYDQAAVREFCKGCDGAFHLGNTIDIDRIQIHPKGWRHRLDCAPLADSSNDVGIPDDRYTS